MKALRLEAVQKLEFVQAEPPVIADDQILVRTGATTICTSDLADIRENAFGVKLPIIMGHEAAGTVTQVGRQVTGFRVGDRVCCHPVHPCNQCPTCRRGFGHLCTDMGHFGYSMPGTFAEYFACRQDRARALPANVAFETGALVEPVCVCLEALERARVKAGDRLLILGDGPFGALMARLAAPLKLGRLVFAGRHDFRLGFGGSAEKVNLKRQALDGDFDAVILAVASAEAVKLGISLLVPRGRLVVFSAITGECPVDMFRVSIKELEIVGSCNDIDMMDRAVELLPLAAELVTHRFKLEQYREALEMATKGREQAMKVAFVF